ncbi:hypothetical protein [Ramlibacter sp. WS9]|uniref:hypothetical protein n=1 Tax=Ramlibacter sp. WS9 TaxID=1882741 RepID=UPI001144FF16|nr:hypothetical protein [Ramlibacter sp. WS9]ROZ64127.1 hypothetical protein EEB15_29135 [Ramlibacter sp. WS9]
MTAPLIALTSYYNPFHGQRRRRNYDRFRRYLGVPLVAVEWSPDGRFDLSAGDADVMLRVNGGDVLWQKERLLNRGLAHIREAGLARDVAIIDADAVFAAADWAERTSAALDAWPVVQCFSRADYLPPLPAQSHTRAELLAVEPERSMPSLAYALSQGNQVFTTDPVMVQTWVNASPLSGNPGLATAVRLAELPEFKLYEGNIVGGGDLVLMAGIHGALDDLFLHRHFSPGHRADVLAWAARCLPSQARLGWAEGRVLHLWHGTMEARRLKQRQLVLGPRDYDPQRDVDRNGDALRFKDPAGELKAAVEAYLVSRDDA